MGRMFKLFVSAFFVIIIFSAGVNAEVYISGGTNLLYMDAQGTYNLIPYDDPFELNRDPFPGGRADLSFTDSRFTNWSNRYLPGFDISLGYKVHSNHMLSFGVDYLIPKKSNNGSGSRDIQTENDGNIIGGTAYVTSNVYTLDILRLNVFDEISINSFMHLRAGLSYYFLQFGREIIHKDNTVGIVLGVGYQKPFYNNFSIVADFSYYFANARGELFTDSPSTFVRFQDVELNIGGMEIGLKLRYKIFD